MISDAVLSWYDTYRRDLPWRYSPFTQANPYHVWLSEIMLQQTTVATVIDYFQRFITRWPSIHHLAEASLEDVLHAWQGLGYYSRARNLHRCAQVVVALHEGQFPITEEDLIKLPGIGPYTAAAISSIAFQQKATVVDGNIDRIMSRLHAFEVPIADNKKAIYEKAALFTPCERPGDYAQALMDIGATICTPQAPNCPICPLQDTCKAYKSKTPEQFPPRKERVKIPTRYAIAYIDIKESGILMRRRPLDKMLGGLVEMPSTPWDTKEAEKTLNTKCLKSTIRLKHTFSHFHLITYIIQDDAEHSILNGEEFRCKPEDLPDYPLSTLTKKILVASKII